MASQIGLSQSQLDEIELRLIGADFRPWAVSTSIYDENGRPIIVKASKKARQKAEWRSISWSGEDIKPTDQLDRDSIIKSAVKTYDGSKPPDVIDDRLYARALSLFKLCDEATAEMGDFVAHAPEDVETLLAEVKRLRSRLRSTEEERDEFKKDMLSLRVEKQSISEKYTDLRKSLREFGKAMKEASNG